MCTKNTSISSIAQAVFYLYVSFKRRRRGWSFLYWSHKGHELSPLQYQKRALCVVVVGIEIGAFRTRIIVIAVVRALLFRETSSARQVSAKFPNRRFSIPLKQYTTYCLPLLRAHLNTAIAPLSNVIAPLSNVIAPRNTVIAPLSIVIALRNIATVLPKMPIPVKEQKRRRGIVSHLIQTFFPDTTKKITYLIKVFIHVSLPLVFNVRSLLIKRTA